MKYTKHMPNSSNNAGTQAPGGVGGRVARHQRGQSLVAAIIILFLLLFLGGIFIALIANNFKNTQRAVNTTASSGFAEAGIRYLDEQLTKSPEGADWRPAPSNVTNQADPDYYWLQPYNATTDEGGFTRVTYGSSTQSAGNTGGRALVRVTYRPNPADPISKYLKLESVGRAGVVDPSDPTTFGNSERAGLRRELLAYKAIGITDYMRFVTNKDNKPGPVSLGSPFSTFDRPAAGNAGLADIRQIESIYNGPVRINGPVQFFGNHQFVLDPTRNDSIEIAGSISLNNISPTETNPASFSVIPSVTNTNPTSVAITVGANTNFVFPSTSTAFTTYNGLVRDAPAGAETLSLTDAQTPNNRNLRNTPRLAPPILDAEIGQRGLTRYRALTREAAPLPPAETVNNPITVGDGYAGAIGWGRGLYIPNTQDVQAASFNIVSGDGFNLRNDWLTPGGTTPTGSYTSWRGDLSYVPPAVSIEFTPRYMKITQFQPTNIRGRRSYMRRPNGQRITQTTIVRYGSIPSDPGARLTNPPTSGLPADNPAPNQYRLEGYPSGDFVIYCEGNARVRGIVGGIDPESGRIFKRNVTVVSNGTIYVDGNLLRDNITPASPQTAQIFKGASSIALLARDYVCVNTTQFFSPAETSYEQETSDPNKPPSRTPQARVLGPQEVFNFGLSIGPESLIANGYNSNAFPQYFVNGSPDFASPMLLVRHTSAYTSSTAGGTGAVINFFANGAVQPLRAGAPDDNVPSETYIYQAYALDTTAFFPAAGGLGLTNLLAIQNAGGDANYRSTRTALVPADIRIEAFMYAQEGSFFIIPGPWFNPNPNDTYDSYITPDVTGVAGPNGPIRGRRAEETQGGSIVHPRYPFYGQPLDVRITFYGGITENLPAEIGDQGAWLEKWGWVPRFYGSTGLVTAPGFAYAADPTQSATAVRSVHGNAVTNNGNTANPYFGTGEGIVYVYDPKGSSPYVVDVNGNRTPVRPNPYNANDPLPIVPRLPVAPGLLYYGEVPLR